MLFFLCSCNLTSYWKNPPKNIQLKHWNWQPAQMAGPNCQELWRQIQPQLLHLLGYYTSDIWDIWHYMTSDITRSRLRHTSYYLSYNTSQIRVQDLTHHIHNTSCTQHNHILDTAHAVHNTITPHTEQIMYTTQSHRVHTQQLGCAPIPKPTKQTLLVEVRGGSTVAHSFKDVTEYCFDLSPSPRHTAMGC